MVDTLASVASARSVEPATVALAWLLAKGVHVPIASASNVEQLPALMAAPSLQLSDAEVAALDAASASFAA